MPIAAEPPAESRPTEPEPPAGPAAAEPRFEFPDPAVAVEQALLERFGEPVEHRDLADGIRAMVFRAEAPPHWIIATLGLHPWQHELTVRVPRTDSPAPPWAFELLSRAVEAVHTDKVRLVPPRLLRVGQSGELIALLVLDDPSGALGDLSLLTLTGVSFRDRAVALKLDHFGQHDLGALEKLQRAQVERPTPWMIETSQLPSSTAEPAVAAPGVAALSRAEAAWARIEGWLEQKQPGITGTLAGPARPAALRKIEKGFGAPLPDDVRRSWLRHDGEGEFVYLIPGGYELLSAKEIAEAYAFANRWTEKSWAGIPIATEGPVRAVGWNPRWLPLCDAGESFYICVDFDPAAGGTVGQVIELTRDGRRTVMARSWAGFLTQLAENLEQEFFMLDEDGSPVPIEPLAFDWNLRKERGL